MNRYLVLENGTIFKGKGFGADGTVIAEVVFTTSMTGYLETLTDKSYTGQAVVQTFPMIGNYGVIPQDSESDGVGVSAYIVREWCEKPSNFRCECDLDTYLKKNGIVGLYDIDTRALTRILREYGVMNGAVTDDPDTIDIGELKNFKVCAPVNKVSVKKACYLEAENARFNVALLDFGMKSNIARSLTRRGCNVHLLPYNTSVQEILALNPDGIFLSNGPGDPQDNTEVIDNVRELSRYRIPTMGICLGHQLLALANGFTTEKLKYGHRGANHPVRYIKSGRVYISSQNHGYTVLTDSIDTNIAEPLFVNVNDNTNEGIAYKHMPAFSVQFHPEACGGPQDTEFLFDDFINMMEERNVNRK